METFIIEVADEKAKKLIKDLEELQIIKILNPDKKESSSKLSDRLRGSISAEQAEKMHEELRQMRDEWERDIF